jgi:predicted nucleic acid-binding protein
MTVTVFIDSNIWVYYYSMKPDEKFARAQEIIISNFTSLVISTQSLGELYNVLVKKNMASQVNARRLIADLASEFPIVEIGTDTVLKAIDLSVKYGYSYWDSLIIATALVSNCGVLYSEDMQHDQLIENKLRIVNPLI